MVSKLLKYAIVNPKPLPTGSSKLRPLTKMFHDNATDVHPASPMATQDHQTSQNTHVEYCYVFPGSDFVQIGCYIFVSSSE